MSELLKFQKKNPPLPAKMAELEEGIVGALQNERLTRQRVDEIERVTKGSILSRMKWLLVGSK